MVITCCHAGSFFRQSLALFQEQCRGLRAEIIIATADAGQMEACSTTRVLDLPGHSVFALHAAGVMAAQGSIIAITEDHCQPPKGWCLGILQSHREHPDLSAIGGGVLNGTPSPLLAEANFLAGFGALMPPLGSPPSRPHSSRGQYVPQAKRPGTGNRTPRPPRICPAPQNLR